MKQHRLETAELLENSRTDPKSKEKGGDDGSGGGFVAQLTTKVIDNLQFSMENIHIRYEDNVSYPNHPFAAGITLKELSAVSTNGEWEPTFISELTNTIHKLAKLESLSVYWNTNASSLAGLSQEEASKMYTQLIPCSNNSPKDHQYIVKPVSGVGKVKLHKVYNNKQPKADITLLFDELAFGLDDEQYRDVLLLVDLFHRNLKKQQYLKFHPPPGVTPKSNPKAYFKFAGEAVLSKIHERNYKWTWDHFKTRRDQRKAYIEYYTALKKKTATVEQKKKLTELERALSFEDIIFYRSMVKSRLRKEKMQIEEEKKKNANKGWFSSWWGSSSSTGDSGAESDDDSIVLTDQQKKELYDAIEYDEDKAAIEAAVDMPKDTMKFVLNTKLNRGSFRLIKHPNTDKHELASIVFDAVSIEAIQYIESTKLSASLGDLRLYDGSTENTIYPQLIGVKKSTRRGTLSLLDSNRSGQIQKQEDFTGQLINQKPFLSVEYQRKPLNKKADQSIKLNMRHLEIIYNPTLIQGAISFLTAHSKDNESFGALIEVAGDTIEGFKRQTRAGLEYALETHSTLDLDIDIDAPIIIIPESCLLEDSNVMIVDAGHIHVDSDLANQEVAQSFKADTEKNFGPEDYKRLENLMYDRFNVELTQMKLLIGRNIKKCIAQLENDSQDYSDGDAHILRRIDIKLMVELCILPGITHFTKIKVSGNLPNVNVNFSSHKYKTLMKMIDIILSATTTTNKNNDENGLDQQTKNINESVTTSYPNDLDNLLSQHLWGEDETNLLLMDNESLASLNGSESRLSRRNSGASNTELARSQQEQFKFTFNVGKVSVLLYESTILESIVKDRLLCELVLEQFGLEFINKPYDMYVHVRLRALDIIDKMEHGKEYFYLVTSGDGSNTGPSDTIKDLVDVKFQRVNRDHPLYASEFDSYDQTVNVILSRLTFVVTRESALTLYNWIMVTFTDSGNAKENSNPSPQDISGSQVIRDDRSSIQSYGTPTLSKNKQAEMEAPTPTAQNDSSMKVNIQMVGVQLVLNKDGVRLATGLLSYGQVEIFLLPTGLKVGGKFGNFVLTDDSTIKVKSNDSNNDGNDTPLNESEMTSNYYLQKISNGMSDVKLLSIEGDELLDFTYETFDPTAKNFPGYQQKIYLKLGAFRLLFLDTLKPVLDFLSEFLEMKTVYDSARLAAEFATTSNNYNTYVNSIQEAENDNNNNLLHFDIMIQTPIIVFPVGEKSENNVIMAYLGEIRAKNQFITTPRPQFLNDHYIDTKVNQIQCGLYAISLRSSFLNDTKTNQPILEDVNITVCIESALESGNAILGPITNIHGHISDVMMYLSESQYAWLLEIQDKLMKTFLAQDDSNNESMDGNEQDQTQPSPLSATKTTTVENDKNKEVAVSNDSQSTTLKTQLELTFDMGLICLEIYNYSGKDITHREDYSLCRISLDDILLKLQTTSDGSMLMEVQVYSFNFYDTRKYSKSCFKDFLPAGKHLGGPQLQIQYKTGKTEEGQPTVDFSLSVDRPQIVVSLDYLLLLKGFVSAPFAPEPKMTDAQEFAALQRTKSQEGNQNGLLMAGNSFQSRSNSLHSSNIRQQQQQQHQQQQQQQKPARFYFNISIIDLELVCLANPDIESSEAMVISFKKFHILQKEKLLLQIDGMSAILCRMDRRAESNIPLIEPFNVDIDMETTASAPGHHITNILVDVQLISLRFSYHDVMLILEIINKVTALLGPNETSATTTAANGDDDSNSNNSNSDTDIEELDQYLQPSALITRNGYLSNLESSETSSIHSEHHHKSRKIEPYIIMSSESLTAKFQGFEMIIVEDLHDLPFMNLSIEPFELKASDWTRAPVASLTMDIYFNYFNFKNSHWEPLIEPYNFGIQVKQDTNTKSLNINLESATTLNFNLTHTFIETAISLSSTLSEIQPLPENAQKQVSPFLIQNRTGYDLNFWNMSEDALPGDTNIYLLKNGDDQGWTFRSGKNKNIIRSFENILGVEIKHSNWSSIQQIPLDVEGQHTYKLTKDKRIVQHRLIVDIKLENHIKKVTFHSGLTLENKTENSMQVTMVNSNRQIISPIWTIESMEVLYVPIGLSYHPWVVFRPSENYHWNDILLHWSDMVHPKGPTVASCKPNEESQPNYYYQLHAIFDSKNHLHRRYPVMKLQFGAPIKITNLLPFDFKWKMVDQDLEQDSMIDVKHGASEQLHTFKSDGNIAFSLGIDNEDYDVSDLTAINTLDPETRNGFPLALHDKNGNTIYLGLIISRHKNSNHALHIKVYSPYLIVNKCSYPITMRTRDSNFGYKSTTSVHVIEPFETKMQPYMFSYSKSDHSNRSEISIKGSKWSQPLSFEAIGSSSDVCLSLDRTLELHSGIHVDEGLGIYHLTKIVTINPRYILTNHTQHKLKLVEYESDDPISVDIDEQVPIYCTKKSRTAKWLCLQLYELDNCWSTPFDIQEVGNTFIKLPKADGNSRPILIKATVILKDATIYISLKQSAEWPYHIINYSTTNISFYQEPPENDDIIKSKKSTFKPRKYSLTPEQKMMKYSWDLPATKERRLILEVEGKTRTIDFQAIGSQIPFIYKKRSSQSPSKILSIDIAARDSSLILLITDFNQENSIFRPMSSGDSTTLASSRESSSIPVQFETVDIEYVVNYTFALRLHGIGVSVINKRNQEIAYMTIRDFSFTYTDSNLYQSLRMGIQWLQIDNQLYGASYPILFYPTTLPKKAPPNDNTHPAFHLALDKLKDTSLGVVYFKLFSVLLQEMSFEIDEDLLFALMEFAQFDTTHQDNDSIDTTLFSTQVDFPAVEQEQALLYFENFCIQPMRLNLSFVRSTHESTVDTTEQHNSPISYVFNVFTMTIGNVNDAPVKLNALIVENLRASSQDLTSRIILHYRDQVLFQIHKVVGSADLIGNPVGLFNNLSSGFGELFYEPYQGFITSDRPQDLGLGIARGIGGFMKKSVFGFTDSFSRFTGSLGKGLATATMDKKFQDRRRMQMTRNKPQHAILGVTQGVTYLGTSFASGIAGIVKRPLEGAEESGVGGFMGGVGKGLVGTFNHKNAVTKPVVGIFDFASNISAGIRETTNLFEAGDILPERLPRFTGRDGVLRLYGQREALGQLWLKQIEDGQHKNERYFAHCMANSDEWAVILTYQNIFLIQTKKFYLEWYEKLDNLETYYWTKQNTNTNQSEINIGNSSSSSNTGQTHHKENSNCDCGILTIKTKSRPPRIRTIHFEEATSGEWFTNQIQLMNKQRVDELDKQ
ncbi:hypothetical protein BJ944DRAFT_290009 [Cunninghamella echinulata]|nr:hypothetical protein BJ944DRAFT_290009 [Cunninghamella echinulata]